jgi:nicotinic acid mononucleotide adenylyltransferase
MAKKVVLGWGRFNPPTIGHSKVVDSIKRIASSTKADAMLYLSHTENSTTDPVPYTQKIQFATKAFGRLVKQSSASNITQILQELEKQGYTNVILVVGQDRIREFDTFLHKYNGIDYHFSNLKIVSAGMRDPDAEGATGMSGSKMRQYAVAGDFTSFKKGVPSKLKGKNVTDLYNMVRKGMGLSEETFVLVEKKPMTFAQGAAKAKAFKKVARSGKFKAAVKRARTKMPNQKQVMKRAQKAARTMVVKKLLQGKSPAKMSFGDKQALKSEQNENDINESFENLSIDEAPPFEKRTPPPKGNKDQELKRRRQASRRLKGALGIKAKKGAILTKKSTGKQLAHLDTRGRRRAKNDEFKRFSGNKSRQDVSMSRRVTIDKKIRDSDASQTRINAKTRQKKKEVRKDILGPKGIEKTASRPKPKTKKREEKRNEALEKKSNKYGVDVAILYEVFNRGLVDYYRGKPNTLTEEQYAFNRVNSFLEGGSACKEDNDLLKKVALAEAMRGVYQKEPKSWKQVRKFGADLDKALEKFVKTNKKLSDRMAKIDKKYKKEQVGEWGTDKLRKKYAKDTPGQTEELNQMFDKYSVKQPQDVMERRDNIDWILSLISRQSHPKEFAGALKRFLSLSARDKGRKHTSGAAIAKAAQEFGLQPRQLQDFIDKLVKKGKLPTRLVAEYMPKENK